MRVVVQKYGGSSVADTDRIKNVANRIAKKVQEGYKVVSVISAMGKTTDQLINLAKSLSQRPDERELDMLLVTGEQVSCALVAITLKDIGINAISLNAFQAKILTTKHHTNARIMDISVSHLREYLKEYDVIVVTGFQGVTEDGHFTTLGRGGSDTSAVALAAKLKCDCEIYSDVVGVYSCDPRLYPNAKKWDYITYDDMLELAATGAKVLHSRSVEIAKKYNVKIYCASSFSQEEGTWVVDRLPEWLEEPVVTGVSLDRNQMKVSIMDLPNEATVIADIFKRVADKGINVDMISLVKNGSSTHVSFTVVPDGVGKIEELLNETLSVYGAKYHFYGQFAKITVVGTGMRSSYGVASKLLEVLQSEQVEPELITTSEIKISVLVPEDKAEMLVKKICEAFEL
ncbi:aspartate kinase [Fervidobacterium nodosum]|uniref:Aspartokinase n=1 Tax=Fervidobacterium nodosum (strain ATCC 35602 / DSM 5306 / Rt17-B1) TaxID=381764 RepID=A7HJ59_FERNB|nr:aspartate kinase [Fervidobacterium nodosum]ABS59942.1 aspartate kinase [Fervidobacterium nodosum Rt17-B1]PHJ12535.1 aspartate kinase [Fervidobacterium sp. SC_NGM5_G05]